MPIDITHLMLVGIGAYLSVQHCSKIASPSTWRIATCVMHCVAWSFVLLGSYDTGRLPSGTPVEANYVMSVARRNVLFSILGVCFICLPHVLPIGWMIVTGSPSQRLKSTGEA